MTYRVQLFKALVQPGKSQYQLKRAEIVTNLGLKLLLLYFFSVAIFTLYAYLGIGTESVSQEIDKVSENKFEVIKLFFLGGKMVAGLVYPTIFLFFSALFLWTLLYIPYRKIVVVQMIVFVLQLVEKLFLIPIYIYLDLNENANLFSLGIVSKYLISNEYFNHFFGQITLFQLAIIAIQYFYLKNFSDKNKYFVLTVICLFYLASWFVIAFLEMIDISLFI